MSGWFRPRRQRHRHALALLVGMALAGGALAALAEPKPGAQPDPPAHASAKQWVFDVRVQSGKPSIERARSASAARPIETTRAMGRYAIELYVGPEFLDRVRFNVPLTGDGPPEGSDRPTKNPFQWPRFENVTTKLRVQMADNPRAAYLVLVDRATESAERFEWPPTEDGKLVPMRRREPSGKPAAPPPAAKDDAGAPKDGGPKDGGPKDGGPKDGADGGAPDGSSKDPAPKG